MSTLFTQIIDGDVPGRFVWRDDVAVAFLTIAPQAPGHVLVVPRQEVDRFTDADDELLAHLMRVAKRIGTAQQEAFSAPRAVLLVLGFEVPHLHVHVLPAHDEGQVLPENQRTDVPAAELDDAAARLRAALRAAGHAEVVDA